MVVINFCHGATPDRLTRQLLDADAIDNGSAEVVVVDNDSPPDPALGRLRRTPGVSLKRFDRNTGFAKAANEGFRLGKGEWILLLNPDTAVPEGFLDQLEALCRSLDQEEPRAGVIGLSLRHSDGTAQASCGPPPTLGRTLAGLCLPRRVRKCRPVRSNDRVAVPWVTGCGMLIRRECWAELGGFDESFFSTTRTPTSVGGPGKRVGPFGTNRATADALLAVAHAASAPGTAADDSAPRC